MTEPERILAELDRVVEKALPEDLPALGLALSARQSALAARMVKVNGHQNGEAHRQPDDHARLLTVPQVAERLAVDKSFVRKLVQRGELPVVELARRCVRVRAADVAEYISRKRCRR